MPRIVTFAKQSKKLEKWARWGTTEYPIRATVREDWEGAEKEE